MAKVKTERIVMDGAVHHELDFKIDINVDADGCFTATLPEHIAAEFKERNVTMKSNGRRNGRPGFYSDKTCEGIIKQIQNDCKEYVSRKLIAESVVIHYIIRTTCSYLMDDNNDVVPNGGWLGGKYATKPEYRWRNGTINSDAANPEPYSISLFVEPAIKRVYQYKSGKKKTEFDRIRDFEVGNIITGETKMGENLYWLSEIVSQKEPDDQGIEEIEYTEPIAFFFVNFVKTICKLNEKLVDLVKPAGIRLIVDKGFNLLEFKKGS